MTKEEVWKALELAQGKEWDCRDVRATVADN